MSKYEKKLHFKDSGDDSHTANLYTTTGGINSINILPSSGSSDSVSLFTVGVDDSYPALRVNDNNDTVFGALVSTADSTATNLRCKYDNTVYSVAETFPDEPLGAGYIRDSSTNTVIWKRIDNNGNLLSANIDVGRIEPWKNVETVVINGNVMVKIPKFYVRAGTIESGTLAGMKGRWVSSKNRDGFHIHPAFVRNNKVLDCIYIGAYEASLDGNSKAASIVNVTPSARRWVNTDCPTGFRFQYLYDIAAINYLLLVELGTPDAQAAIARGNVDAYNYVKATGSTDASWRGIKEWWGNGQPFIGGGSGVIRTSTSGNKITVRTTLPSNRGDNTFIVYDSIPMSSFSVCTPYELDDYHVTGLDLNDLFIPKTDGHNLATAVLPDYTNYASWYDNRYTKAPSNATFVHNVNGSGEGDGPFACYLDFDRFDTDNTQRYPSHYARIAKDGELTDETAPTR